VWSYSGVRPLVEDEASDAAAVTRDYRLELEQDGAPLLNVFGGKLTTYRKLSEEAMDMLAPLLGCGPAWTSRACLPGGDTTGPRPASKAVRQFSRFVQQLQKEYPWLAPALVQRYARAYGTRTRRLLQGCASLEALGEQVLPGLYEAEIDYLRSQEFAVTAADILWRRSKLGLHLGPDAGARLDAWLAAHRR
jgi:glycerol-3-phosphate dehydrogenase